MTCQEFTKLKVGDLTSFIRGKDTGRLCEVAYIEGNYILVRPADGQRFNGGPNFFSHENLLRLTHWHELSLIKN